MNKRYLLLACSLVTACIFAKVALKNTQDDLKKIDTAKEVPTIKKEIPVPASVESVMPDVALVKVDNDSNKVTTVTIPEKKIASIDTQKDSNKGAKTTTPEQKIASVDTKKAVPIAKKLDEKATVNKIAIVVYTDDEPIMITQHSLNCKTLDGRMRTRHELLMEKLMCYEALNYYKMPITDEMVDKHLASLKEMHGIGDAQIKQLFKEAGYTYEEGREQLRASYAIQSLMGQLVDGRVVVAEEDVKAFYDKNPLKEQASFRIQTAFIKEGDLTSFQMQDLVEDGLYKDLVVWDSPYSLDIDEIAESKKYIISMKPGEIKSEKVKDGYQVVMLVKRKKERVKPFEECRSDIIAMLRVQSRKDRFASYEKELLGKYDIVYLT